MTHRFSTPKKYHFHNYKRPALGFWSQPQNSPSRGVVVHIPWEDLEAADFPTLDMLRKFMQTGKLKIP